MIHEKGLKRIGDACVKIGEALEKDDEISNQIKQEVTEILTYLIQHIGYGSTPPKMIVLALVKSMKEKSKDSLTLVEHCTVLEEQVDKTYP